MKTVLWLYVSASLVSMLYIIAAWKDPVQK